MCVAKKCCPQRTCSCNKFSGDKHICRGPLHLSGLVVGSAATHIFCLQQSLPHCTCRASSCSARCCSACGQGSCRRLCWRRCAGAFKQQHSIVVLGVAHGQCGVDEPTWQHCWQGLLEEHTHNASMIDPTPRPQALYINPCLKSKPQSTNVPQLVIVQCCVSNQPWCCKMDLLVGKVIDLGAQCLVLPASVARQSCNTLRCSIEES